MQQFLSLVVAGLSLGVVYALVAMGFVMVFKASEVLNFAHGSIIVIGAYIVMRFHERIGFWPAVLLGLGVAAVAAILIERGLFGFTRHPGPIPMTIATIGVDIVLSTLLVDLMGPGIHDVGQPWGSDVFRVGDIGLPTNRALALVVCGLVIALLLVGFERTSWGMRMRAAAEDPEAAEIIGLRLWQVRLAAWGTAGLLAAVAAIFLTGAPTPGLSPSLATVALAAFPAAIIGGLTSVPGALVGGLLIGVSETLVTGYQDQLLFLGRGIGPVIPYLVLILVLIWRPEGLFGERSSVRV